jgi:hypothetical protein
MAVKDARCVRAAKRSSAARSLTATAAKGTAPWAGATLVIMGRSSPNTVLFRGQTPCPAVCNFLSFGHLFDRHGDREGER